MDSGLTITFDGSFWSGYFYVNDGMFSQAVRIIFGPCEPTEAEIYQLILNEYNTLTFSQKFSCEEKPIGKFGYKTTLRKAKKFLKREIETPRSLEIIKKQYEELKKEKPSESSFLKNQKKQEKFQLQKLKKKKKKQGH